MRPGKAPPAHWLLLTCSLKPTGPLAKLLQAGKGPEAFPKSSYSLVPSLKSISQRLILGRENVGLLMC